MTNVHQSSGGRWQRRVNAQRYGKRTTQGILKDGWNTLNSVLQGHYILSVSCDMAPVAPKGGIEGISSFLHINHDLFGMRIQKFNQMLWNWNRENPWHGGCCKGRDILEINHPEGPFGTKEAPAVVKSYYDQRIVGCPGGEGEDEHDVVWFWLKKDQPHECPVCTQYFKLEVVGPGGLPDHLDEDEHH